MKEGIFQLLLILICSVTSFAQVPKGMDAPLAKKKMQRDLELFRNIRDKANAGLYTYRTRQEIDSIYQWAAQEVTENATTYRDFFNLINALTDFEGSCHNMTRNSKKVRKAIREESGYFPYPVELIEGKLIVNYKGGNLPLGAEILDINGQDVEKILPMLHKYFPTDGYNKSGKKIGLHFLFVHLYRYQYGLQNEFVVKYKTSETKTTQVKSLAGIKHDEVFDNFEKRHRTYSNDDRNNETDYEFEYLEEDIAKLSLRNFGFDGSGEEHEKYKYFLDSVLTVLNTKKTENLIVDLRGNGGGSSPNDMVALSCFTSELQPEVDSAYVIMNKVHYSRYLYTGLPFYMKPIVKMVMKNRIKKEVPFVKGDRRYYTDIVFHEPHPKAYKGNLYLIINPLVASAASIFAAMLKSETDVTVVGEETLGGYYRQSGTAVPVIYQLPKSKIKTIFSVVNLKQAVKQLPDQIEGRGVCLTTQWSNLLRIL